MSVNMNKVLNLTGTKEVIDTKDACIAPVESTSTASQAYAVGQRFWYAGKLYIATADIASGGTITPNTNCKLDVLGDDLTSQSAKIDLIGNNLIKSTKQYNNSGGYYTLISELEVGKTYKIGVTVATSGNYGVSLHTAPSISSSVADLFYPSTHFTANVQQYVLYTPVGTGEIYIRLTSNTVSWSASISELVDSKNLEENAVKYHENVAINLGTNRLNASSPVTLSTGWSGDFTNGFTHTSGNSGSFYFGGGVTSGLKCIVDFDATGVDDSKLFVRIGNNPRVDIYNGSNHFTIGFIADGGNLMFTPAESYSGTITNIKLQEIVTEGGTQSVITQKSVNHEQTIDDITGFWNVAIGADNTQDSNVNGTRNIGIGYASQHLLKSGNRNIGIGTFSMPFLTSGDRNIAIGADSLYSTKNYQNPKGNDNIAIGYRAMADGTDIQYNVGIGTKALSEIPQDAKHNVAVGDFAGVYAQSGVTAIGQNAGTRSYTKQSNSIFVGRNTGVDNTGATSENQKTVSNCVAIGDGVLVKNSNEARFGNATNIIYLAGKKILFNQDGTVTWEAET